MKKGNRTAAALAVLIAGSMIYSAQPADAKGILSKTGLRVDEINITLKGKNSHPAPPPPPPPPPAPPRAMRRPPEPPRGYFVREQPRHFEPHRHMPPPPPPPHRGRG